MSDEILTVEAWPEPPPKPPLDPNRYALTDAEKALIREALPLDWTDWEGGLLALSPVRCEVGVSPWAYWVSLGVIRRDATSPLSMSERRVFLDFPGADMPEVITALRMWAGVARVMGMVTP